jgi:hypothetical protein
MGVKAEGRRQRAEGMKRRKLIIRIKLIRLRIVPAQF